MIQGSSIATEVVSRVQAIAHDYPCILVCLDSNHTHDHVLAELYAYAQLVTPGSYCIVFDTIIEDQPADKFIDRTWGPGNSPMSAIREYLKSHSEFEIDKLIDRKLLISVAPEGYLKRIA
jgi:cephalosporin hydroxylase